MIIEIVIICSAIILIVYIIAKSKCSTVDCCGMHVTRDINMEEKTHEYDVEHGVKELPNILELINPLNK